MVPNVSVAAGGVVRDRGGAGDHRVHQPQRACDGHQRDPRRRDARCDRRGRAPLVVERARALPGATARGRARTDPDSRSRSTGTVGCSCSTTTGSSDSCPRVGRSGSTPRSGATSSTARRSARSGRRPPTIATTRRRTAPGGGPRRRDPHAAAGRVVRNPPTRRRRPEGAVAGRERSDDGAGRDLPHRRRAREVPASTIRRAKTSARTAAGSSWPRRTATSS